MIHLELMVRLAGVMVGVVAVLSLRDPSNPKRYKNALFWGTYATTLVFGSILPDFVNGCLVIVLALVGGLGGLGRAVPKTTGPEVRAREARLWGNKLFVPALIIPILTLLGALLLPGIRIGHTFLVDPKNVSVICLGMAAMVALVVATVMLRQPISAPAQECRRLMDMVGWAAVLPQMLAALGALFALAGVGGRISDLVGHWIPLDNSLAVVCAYTFGMASFTIVMGNAFAAFPVMTAAVGLPLIVGRLGGDPAIMAALGMLSGFCGTLMTPMAANFNIVPAALLELPDKNAVIKAQIPTALLLLVANTLLMYFLVFHHG